MPSSAVTAETLAEMSSDFVLARSNFPDENIDIARLARCNKKVPATCLETSKNQILSGRLGRSLQRLKTRESRARAPNAACTIKANGPRSLHSPSCSSALPLGPFSDPVSDSEGKSSCGTGGGGRSSSGLRAGSSTSAGTPAIWMSSVSKT